MGPWMGVALAFFLALAASAAEGAGYANPDLLVETGELAGLLGAPNVRIIDAADGPAYAKGHIPGAVNLFYLKLSSLPERKRSGYPLSPEEAERIFGGAGIDERTEVIVYDGGEGPPASGVWFALRFFGHGRVRVLNGGLRKWVKEGRPLTQDVPKVEQKKFVARPNSDLVVSLPWMKKHARGKDLVVMDARSLKEFIGEEILPGASRGGHIPGAIHFEWTRVTDAVATFKSGEEIRKALAERGIAKERLVVAYCHTGIGRSTDLLLALKLLGYERVRLYAGSWEEWSSDPRLPIER